MPLSYLNLSKKELNQRIGKLFKNLKNCEICPKKCHRDRMAGERGFCQLRSEPVISAYHPHFAEERVLVGNHGSGTMFFTSCNLSCVFCQNYEISQLRISEDYNPPTASSHSSLRSEWAPISYERLAQMMIELQNLGCHNINLVSPTSHVPAIVKSLLIAREQGLKLPLVYNTNAYDSVEVLKLLDGIIDIYMPDAKYSSDVNALKYSSAPNYFEIMKKAIKEMHRQVGDLIINKKGIAVKGLLVRHLVLPNNLAGTKEITEFLAKEISKNTFLNIMNQYFPYAKASQYPELSRRISQKEFKAAIELAKKAGLKRLYRE